ncbi:MAG: TonB-dependent receptor [Sulfitobacter sp. SK025]|nr:MAG: TonB-dependent receptor [Sulfitobacter sp. SK025]
MGEIVVTAQKRGQNLQDVGIAITAITGDQITALGVTDSIDVARLSSNVSVSGSYAGQMSQFTIRGITQNDFNDHVESVIAVYIDDAYVASQQGQTFAMFDIERVEALKGPQGTLFGRNATGGLVHYITRRPTDYLDGYVDVRYGSYDNVRTEAAISGPLSENVRARLSGLFERYDGYIKNKYPEETFVPDELVSSLNSSTLPGAGADLGGLKSNWALRGQVEIDLSPDTELWIAGFGGHSEASTGPYQQVPTVAVLDADGNHINTLHSTPDQICQVIQLGECVHGAFSTDQSAYRPVAGADWFGYLDPDGSGKITSSDYTFDDVNTLTTYGTTVRLSSRIGEVNVTSISDYKKFKKNFNLDLEAGPENQFAWHGIANTDAFTQELRFDGAKNALNWVAGLYYLNIDNHSVHGIAALPDSAYPIPSWDQPRIANLKTESYSAFAHVEYELTDTLTAIGGLRWTREKKDYDFEVLFVYPNDDGDPYGWDYSPAIDFPGFSQGLYSNKSTETLWSWKAQLNWEPTPDLLIYGGVTQGAKAGSYNAGGPPLVDDAIPYKPEKLISYEVGFKSTLFDGSARFNAAAFYYDYKNYQAARWLGFSSLISNADATIYGGEAELTASVFDNLETSFNVGVQDNKVKDVLVGGELRDVETTFTPKLTLSGTIRYTVPADVAGGALALQASGNYQSKVWHNLTNFDANQLDAYGILNARVDWTSNDDHLNLSFSVRNLTNKVYDNIGFDLSQVCGCNLQAQGKPRWFEFGVRYSL